MPRDIRRRLRPRDGGCVQCGGERPDGIGDDAAEADDLLRLLDAGDGGRRETGGHRRGLAREGVQCRGQVVRGVLGRGGHLRGEADLSLDVGDQVRQILAQRRAGSAG